METAVDIPRASRAHRERSACDRLGLGLALARADGSYPKESVDTLALSRWTPSSE